MHTAPPIVAALILATSTCAQDRKEPTCAELLRSTDRSPLPLDQVAAERARLWAKYRVEQVADATRRKEHEEKKVSFGGKTMRYAYSKIGDKPADGYPLYIALHGGGGAPARVNDRQWNHMKRYYRSGVKRGIYVATRGVTNTWNLHSVSESFPCYDRLIENMILFEGVDPNRVYVLGFSAGGDGTYQIAPRMADRWAAANMSAGHPNGVSPRNLCNVPFMVQMGENDRAYGRNSAAVKYFIELRKLRRAHPNHYVHAANIHFGKPHNFFDNHPKMAPQKVLSDPVKWLENGDRKTVSRNTHAIAWLDGHVRRPRPGKVIWDLSTRATSRGRPAALHYWLDLTALDPGKIGGDVVIARLDKRANAVEVEACGDYLRVLLRQGMLDLARPVRVQVAGRTFQVSPRATRRNLLQTMLDRGDPHLMFEASITIEKKDDAWTVTSS